MSREPLVVSFDANSPLLTHFNVANEVRGADLNPAVLGPEQVCKHRGGAAAAPSGHHRVKIKASCKDGGLWRRWIWSATDGANQKDGDINAKNTVHIIMGNISHPFATKPRENVYMGGPDLEGD